MTFSQLWDYTEALDDHRRRELRERAIAARAAQAEQKEWQSFLETLEQRPGAAAGETENLDAFMHQPIASNLREDEIEWLKSKSE